MRKIFVFCVLILLVLSSCNKPNTDAGETGTDGIKTEESVNMGGETGESIDTVTDAVYNDAPTEVVYNEVIPYFNNRIVFREGNSYGVMDNEGNVLLSAAYSQELKMISEEIIAYDGGAMTLSGEELFFYDYGSDLGDEGIEMIGDNYIYVYKPNIYWERNTWCEDPMLCEHKIYSLSERRFIEELTGEFSAIAVEDNILIRGHFIENEKYYYLLSLYSADGENLFSIKQEGYNLDMMSDVYTTSQDKEFIIYSNYIIDASGSIVYEINDNDDRFLINNRATNCSDYVPVNSGYFVDLNKMESVKDSKFEIDPYSLIETLSNGMYKIKLNGCYGIINEKGDTIIKPIYYTIGEFINGDCSIVLEDYRGSIDEKGNVICQPILNWFETNNHFTYDSDYKDGALIDPRTGEILPYYQAELVEGRESEGIYEAILTDEATGEKYKSFVTWNGKITEHRFPMTDIKISNDGRVAVYNNGAVYTICTLP